MSGERPRTAILISGRGSNMLRLVEAARDGRCHIDPVAVISNRPSAEGLQRAAEQGIDTRVVDHTQYPDRESFDAALGQCLQEVGAELILLAGFMRILTDALPRHYQGRMLNIHPSLLPKYPGLNTHARALAAGDDAHGATVHFVTPELDSGPLIIQSHVPIETGDSEETLTRRVLDTEHRIYTLAADWVGRGWVQMRDGQATLFERNLYQPVKYRNGQLHGVDPECLQRLLATA
ncbi:MAG: phosphoribosylglycinamide formyltransferase [Pseudomonadota bacterium]